MEKFNPGVFTSTCVRDDIIEMHLQKMLAKMISYIKKRKAGVIQSPGKVLTMENAPKKAKTAEPEEEKKGKGKGKGKKGKRDRRDMDAAELAEAWNNMPDTLQKWDEED